MVISSKSYAIRKFMLDFVLRLAYHADMDDRHPTTGESRKGNNMFYAIEIIGYGKRRRYCIKQVIPGKGTNPTNGKCYRTESAARAAAEELGYEIAKCGDLYQII